MPVEVKICGLSTPATMAAALAAGADLVGLVFFAKSPRNVSLVDAARLADLARGRAKVVALMVDADDDFADNIASTVRPDLLQLHGSETPARAAAIRARYGLPVMKAIGVASRVDVERARSYLDVVDRILFDAKPAPGASLPGGNGAALDWTMIAGLGETLPFMLSGGLDPLNVADAIKITAAGAVDVSSGVETAPGVKSERLIEAFMTAARGGIDRNG